MVALARSELMLGSTAAGRVRGQVYIHLHIQGMGQVSNLLWVTHPSALLTKVWENSPVAISTHTAPRACFQSAILP